MKRSTMPQGFARMNANRKQVDDSVPSKTDAVVKILADIASLTILLAILLAGIGACLFIGRWIRGML